MADFNLNFLDNDTYEPLTHIITVNGSSNWVARVRFDNDWSRNKHGEKFIHRLDDLIINKRKATITATFESAKGLEFEGFTYTVNVNADIKNNPQDWNKLMHLQEAVNALIQSPVIGFNVKDVFKNDVDKPHATIPIYEHPTHFKTEDTPDSGASDGVIKVFALGGTRPFQTSLDGGPWEDLVTETIGLHDVDTFSFTGLTTGAGAEIDGSYKVRVRDSRAPKVLGKPKITTV